MPERSVSIIVIAYGEEPLLEECVRSLTPAIGGVVPEVVVIDNGCTSPFLDQLPDVPGVVVASTGSNEGFAGGCNFAAEHASGDILVFVNSDAIAQPGAVAALVSAVQDEAVGIATGSVRLLDRPDLMNTAGNPVHFSGISWAGGLGQPASAFPHGREVTAASGAACAIRRTVWQRLGGFYEPMFAYVEDADLSLRCWRSGWRVEYVPEAVFLHRYEFSRNELKMYLLERNRLIMVLTVFPRVTLLKIFPVLLVLELAISLVAARQGWLAEKAKGWRWIFANRAELRRRRSEIQSIETDTSAFESLLTGDFSPGAESGFSAPRPLTMLSRWYWRAATSGPQRTKGDAHPKPGSAVAPSTADASYAHRLVTKQGRRWKQLLRVQAIYQWNLRRYALGRTLDIGCGIGRNLHSLDAGSVGVDHNAVSVDIARSAGLAALTVEEFHSRSDIAHESFDSLLLAHVVEHLPPDQAREIVREYLPYLRPGGRILFVCPQERGYASDATHITWTTADDLAQLATDVGLSPLTRTSFPLPRWAGRLFTYNEFVVSAVKPGGDDGR
jgi:GT2 family glycosyltransferase/SAM-dependent methyltransferase